MWIWIQLIIIIWHESIGSIYQRTTDVTFMLSQYKRLILISMFSWFFLLNFKGLNPVRIRDFRIRPHGMDPTGSGYITLDCYVGLPKYWQ